MRFFVLCTLSFVLCAWPSYEILSGGRLDLSSVVDEQK
jgi:hypothetical protein